MKYLSELMEDKQTLLFNKTKTFFAFSNEQLEEGKKKHNIKNTKLVSMGGGMICPKENAETLSQGLKKIYNDSILEDIQLHTINRIVLRELANYECFYTGDISDCVENLRDYPGISKKLIVKIFNKNYNKYNTY